MTSSSALGRAVDRARSRSHPLFAFNVFDLSSLQGVVEAAAALDESVIVQVSARTVRHYGAGLIRSAHAEITRSIDGTSFLHLDHCSDEATLRDAIDAGFDGVMFDGSHLPFEENVSLTREWVSAAEGSGTIVEGEITPILGSEDGFAGGEAREAMSVERYLEFVEKTGVRLVGCAVGTSHGLYDSPPEIDFEFIETVCSERAGFVVHGGSGLDGSTIDRLSRLGIAKINFSTEVKLAWGRSVKDELCGKDRFEPLRGLAEARQAVADLATRKLSTVRVTES